MEGCVVLFLMDFLSIFWDCIFGRANLFLFQMVVGGGY